MKRERQLVWARRVIGALRAYDTANFEIVS
jgi:hypothetical protein